MWNSVVRDSVPSQYCLTILRLPVQEVTREQVFNSPQWFDVLEPILSYSNWRFTFLAQEVDSTKLDVFIGWKPNTYPAAMFTQQDGDLDSLLSPLCHFCGPDKPQVINLYALDTKMSSYGLRTEKIKNEDRIMEALTVHGPAEIVERKMSEIQDILEIYLEQRSIWIGLANHRHYKHAMVGRVFLFTELQKSTLEGASRANPESPPTATLTLFIEWSDEEARSQFHDPEVPDPHFPTSSRGLLKSDFWETWIESRLKELTDQGASVTSWDYEKAKIAKGRDGHVTTLRRDKLW